MAYLHRVRRELPTDVAHAHRLGSDQRWEHSDVLWRQLYNGSDYDLVEISETEAVRRVDDVWAASGHRPGRG